MIRYVVRFPRLVAGRVVFWLAMKAALWRDHEGMLVGATVPSPMDPRACIDRIQSALRLIDELVPYRAVRLRREARRILCFGTGPRAALGGYVPLFRMILVDPRHVLHTQTTVPDIARTILHEAVHARLHRPGTLQIIEQNERVEAVCRRAERDLTLKLAARAREAES